VKGSRCGGFRVEAGRESLISSTGASLLLQCAQVSGLTSGLSRQLQPWRALRAVHDPGKTVLDMAMSIALGGDCLADAAVVRAQPELFGVVASDPTISRLIDTFGAEPGAVVAAIRRARAAARAAVWALRSPVPKAGEVVVDLDATLIGAHSEKEGATPNFKRGFGSIR
jgi:Transposase DDE domain group 1